MSLNNALTKRGLGRSSLVSTQGTYLENQRNQALGDIDRDETNAINAINEKIALLTDQAAQSEKTLSGNYARQIEARINELRTQNQTAATNLQLQIAALQMQGYQAYQEWLLAQRSQELAEEEFEWTKSKHSSSGSSGSYGYSASSTNNSQADTGSDSYLDNLLGGGSVADGSAVNFANQARNVVSNAVRTASNAGSKIGSTISNLFSQLGKK